MNLRITRRNYEIDEGLKSYIEKKIGKLTRVFAKVQTVEVVIKGEKRVCACEIEVMARPLHVVSSASAADGGAAFDQALKVVQRALKNQKMRMIQSKRQAGDSKAAPAAEEAEE